MKCARCHTEYPGRSGTFCGACVETFPGSGEYVNVADLNRTEVVAEYRFFTIEKRRVAGGKTDQYEIRNRKHGEILGGIRWYGPWKRFVFLPREGTVWSEDCLMNVMGFLLKLGATWKSKGD